MAKLAYDIILKPVITEKSMEMPVSYTHLVIQTEYVQ